MEQYEPFGFSRAYKGAQIIITKRIIETGHEVFRARIASPLVEVEVTSRVPFRSAEDAGRWAEGIADALALHPAHAHAEDREAQTGEHFSIE